MQKFDADSECAIFIILENQLTILECQYHNLYDDSKWAWIHNFGISIYYVAISTPQKIDADSECAKFIRNIGKSIYNTRISTYQNLYDDSKWT